VEFQDRRHVQPMSAVNVSGRGFGFVYFKIPGKETSVRWLLLRELADFV
jgi:hypothetical protein